MIRITPDRRLYVFGLRLHHGLTCSVGLLICLVGIIDDWHDRKVWLHFSE